MYIVHFVHASSPGRGLQVEGERTVLDKWTGTLHDTKNLGAISAKKILDFVQGFGKFSSPMVLYA